SRMYRTRRNQISRALRQPAPIFGALVIAAFWVSLTYLLSVERTRATNAAIADGDRLTRLIADHAAQLIGTVDQTLLLLRHAYEEKPAQFDLNTWAERAALISGITTEIGIADANLYLYARTGYSGPPFYIGDREHVQAQVRTTTDELFITKPFVLRSTGKTTIQLSRKLRKPDGSFAGTVAIQIDPKLIEDFYQKLGLAPGDNFILRGRDGAIRASYGLGEVSSDESMPPNIARELAKSPVGYFWGSGNVDTVSRLVFYRAVDGLPLVISHGRTAPNIFAEYERQRLTYIAVTSAL